MNKFIRSQKEWDEINRGIEKENKKVGQADARLYDQMAHEGYSPTCPCYPMNVGSYGHQSMMEEWWGEDV